MDAFWCITLGVIVIRLWWRHQTKNIKLKQKPQVQTKQPIDSELAKDMEEERKQQQNIADLKRQGYTDELIATILPVINNNQ